MIIGYPISEKEAKYYLSLEVEGLSEGSMDKIIKFFADNEVEGEDARANNPEYISREDLEDKVISISYDVTSSIEYDLRDAIKEAILDAIR